MLTAGLFTAEEIFETGDFWSLCTAPTIQTQLIRASRVSVRETESWWRECETAAACAMASLCTRLPSATRRKFNSTAGMDEIRTITEILYPQTSSPHSELLLTQPSCSQVLWTYPAAVTTADRAGGHSGQTDWTGPVDLPVPGSILQPGGHTARQPAAGHQQSYRSWSVSV